MSRKEMLTASAIDALKEGVLHDPQTLGLSIFVSPSGNKVWRYRRRIADLGKILDLRLGNYPTHSIAAARVWTQDLNTKVEAGIDPRIEAREEEKRRHMTVARAHALYMIAVRQGRATTARKPNKPRTIKDKLDIFKRDIEPSLGSRVIYDIVESDLTALIEAKGKVAKVRANRLAGELKVFFAWAASLRGQEVGLTTNPSIRLGDLKFPETPRIRKLSHQELAWFLQALAEEARDVQRGMLLWQLTAARISEVVEARSDEIQDGIWTIPASRTKNSNAHSIALGPWGLLLIRSNHEWVLPADRVEGPKTSIWYHARDRVKARMEQIAGHPIEQFTPHDFRRTARSNTKRLKVDFETAEAMLNHVKRGLERTYDQYEFDEEKRDWFHRWEQEVIAIAIKAGVADALGVPPPVVPNPRRAMRTNKLKFRLAPTHQRARASNHA